MDKIDEKIIGEWAESQTMLNFKFKDGTEKQGFVKGIYGLILFVDFGVKVKRAVIFNELESINEVYISA
jgi:hypothetical protein